MRQLLFILAFLPASVVAASPENLDFRGVVLGMPLSEFKLSSASKRSRCKAVDSKKLIEKVTICTVTGMFKLEPFAGTTVVNYEFARAFDDVARLLRIEIVTDASNASDTVEGLTSKFGNQGVPAVNEVQNGFGAKFPQIVWTWRNAGGTQTAVLTSPAARQDMMSLEFVDYSLLRAAAARGLKPSEPSKY